MNIELYVNATSQAYMMTIRRLIEEVSKLKGDESAQWLRSFQEQVITDINAAKNMDGTPRDATVVSASISVVQAMTSFDEKK